MRNAFVLSLILAAGLAGPALAQPAVADNHAQAGPAAQPPAKTEADPSDAQQKLRQRDADAAAALAMAIRAREAEEQRIARYACLGGDTSKCQVANASTTAKTPSP